MKNPKYDQYLWGFTSKVHRFLDKKFAVVRVNKCTKLSTKSVASPCASKSATHTGTRINSNSEHKQLAEELRKPTRRRFKKHKLYSSF